MIDQGHKQVGDIDQCREGHRIGIWARENDRGPFILAPGVDADERRMWADTTVIARRDPQTMRVVLLGESVARGFLLDPHITPAGRLRIFLQSSFSSNCPIDVIDLARTCLTNSVELTAQAIALEPDIFVFFLGNNLLPSTVTDINGCSPEAQKLREGYLQAMETDGVRAAQDWLAKKARETVYEPLLTALFDTVRASGIPAVVVIPEHNREDWNGCVSKAVDELVLLVGDGPLILEEGVMLDGIAPIPPVPRRTEAFVDTINDVAKDYDVTVVDLAAVFADFGPSDRQLFYDYCHLTPLGIDLAMEATAHNILARFGVSAASKRAPLPVPCRPAAQAAFLAAIHNSHWGQKDELVSHWLKVALQLDAGIYDLMHCYRRQTQLATPSWLSIGPDDLFDPRSQCGRVLYNNHSPANEVSLVIALDEVLQAAGIPDISRMERDGERSETGYRKIQFTNKTGLFDLLETSQFLRFDCQDNVMSCYRHSLSFFFYADITTMSQGVMRFILLVRSGDGTPKGPAHVALNGHGVDQISLNKHWARVTIDIKGGDLIQGLNEVHISWPHIEPPSRGELLNIKLAYKNGDRASLLMCRSEVHRSSSVRWIDA